MPNKVRRCRQCKEYNIPKDAPSGQFCCGVECATAYAKKRSQRLRQKAEKHHKQEIRAQRSKFKANDLPRQKALTQTAVNRLVNLLDMGKNCISSNKPLPIGKPRNASHFKSVGSNSFLRYSLLNIHSARVHDNKYRSGNIEGYRKGLLDRYGQWILDYLDNAPRVKKWTADELLALRKTIKLEIRHIEKTGQPSKDWRKLP